MILTNISGVVLSISEIAARMSIGMVIDLNDYTGFDYDDFISVFSLILSGDIDTDDGNATTPQEHHDAFDKFLRDNLEMSKDMVNAAILDKSIPAVRWTDTTTTITLSPGDDIINEINLIARELRTSNQAIHVILTPGKYTISSHQQLKCLNAISIRAQNIPATPSSSSMTGVYSTDLTFLRTVYDTELEFTGGSIWTFQEASVEIRGVLINGQNTIYPIRFVRCQNCTIREFTLISDVSGFGVLVNITFLVTIHNGLITGGVRGLLGLRSNLALSSSHIQFVNQPLIFSECFGVRIIRSTVTNCSAAITLTSGSTNIYGGEFSSSPVGISASAGARVNIYGNTTLPFTSTSSTIVFSRNSRIEISMNNTAGHNLTTYTGTICDLRNMSTCLLDFVSTTPSLGIARLRGHSTGFVVGDPADIDLDPTENTTGNSNSRWQT